MKKLIKTSIVVLLIFSSIVLMGCSVLGLIIGSQTKVSPRSFPGWQIMDVRPNTSVEIIKVDGSQINGVFKGTQQLPVEIYEKKYEPIRQQLKDEVLLPAINEKMEIVDIKGNRAAMEFRGFHYAGVLGFDLALRKTYPVSWRIIRGINLPGETSLDIQKIKQLVESGKIPLPYVANVIQGRSLVEVSVDEIQTLRVYDRKNRALEGFLIGAAADVLVIAALSSRGEEKPKTTSEQEQFSCPYIYSFDGSQFVFAAEPFGGAIFKAAERTDVIRLPKLKATDGYYRLLISNELDETQYVNSLKLWVVEHSSSITVLPTFEGKLIQFENLQPPVQAKSITGENVLPLLQEKDDLFWISNPFGRTSRNKSELRDGIVVSFRRPPESPQVKLAVNVQNTMWASFLQGYLLRLHGTNLPQWYAALNHSTQLRQQFTKAMIREGMLTIEIYDGENWKYAGFIWEVGPNISKDQAIVLDLKNIHTDPILLRFTSTPGLWMINSIQADFSPVTDIEPTVLHPVRAKTKSNADILLSIKKPDDAYYRMDEIGEQAEILFKAISPVDPRKKQSFFVEARGYYTIHVPTDQAPQTALVRQMMQTPDAFGAYSLDLLHQFLLGSLQGRE